MPCGDIQALLYDYMNRELGGARSDLVREHLRHCPNCQKVAADIRRTTELLQAASRAESAIPGHLRMSTARGSHGPCCTPCGTGSTGITS